MVYKLGLNSHNFEIISVSLYYMLYIHVFMLDLIYIAPLLSISEPLVPDTEAAAGCSQKADSTLPAIAITAPLEISLDSLQDKQAKPSKRTEKKESASRKRKLEELEEINLTLDNQRLEEEILKIKEEKEVLTLKKEVLLLKKQKLILDIQTTYPSFIAEM